MIAYASKKLNAQQQRYSVTRRELLAVITFMNHFRHYLLGQKFLLRTDHGSIRWIFEFKDPRGQVARWLEVLAQYDFEYSIGLEVNIITLTVSQGKIMRKTNVTIY